MPRTRHQAGPGVTDIYASIAEKTGLTSRQVASVFSALVKVVKEQLTAGVTSVTIPGLCVIKLRRRAAKPGGIRKIDPLTGQEYITKPKAARNVVVMRPLKSLQEAISIGRPTSRYPSADTAGGKLTTTVEVLYDPTDRGDAEAFFTRLADAIRKAGGVVRVGEG